LISKGRMREALDVIGKVNQQKLLQELERKSKNH
jgi:hypothetical protein